jgi:hypothetical protein
VFHGVLGEKGKIRIKPALTLTLSPGEREQPLSVFRSSDDRRAEDSRGFAKRLETILPLRSFRRRGEGRGEVRFGSTNK